MNKMTLGLVMVISVMLVSGCVQQTGPAINGTGGGEVVTPGTGGTGETGGTGTGISTVKTCAQLNGYECSVGGECAGQWLDASDTFSCCSQACASSGGETLDIELFEEEIENEDLGDVT